MSVGLGNVSYGPRKLSDGLSKVSYGLRKVSDGLGKEPYMVSERCQMVWLRYHMV